MPDALTDAVLDRLEVAGGPLWRVHPRSFDDVREAEALLGPGRPTPYWASVWPAGSALARWVAAAGPQALRGRRVVELGCGIGMPSVAAARAGATVLATDAAPEAVVYAAHNLSLNGQVGDAAVAAWPDLVPLAPFDVLLAADVLYTQPNARTLLELLPQLLAPDGEAWIADPGRAGCRDFLAGARGRFALRSTEDARRPGVHVHVLRAAAPPRRSPPRRPAGPSP